MPATTKPEIQRYSIPEYYRRLAELGLVKAEDKTELVNGQNTRMAPPGFEHEEFVHALADIFSDQRTDRYQVRANSPVQISNFDEPLPDIILCRRDIFGRYPGLGDIFLLVEVAVSSLAYDTGEKLRAYEAAGIPEYWVADLPGKTMWTYCPLASRYRGQPISKASYGARPFPTLKSTLMFCFTRPPEGARP